MLVIIYNEKNRPIQQRHIWTLADPVFPTKIKPKSILVLYATSFELNYIQENFGTDKKEWRDEDAFSIFQTLLERADENYQEKKKKA